MATLTKQTIVREGWACGRPGCQVLHSTEDAANAHAAKPVAKESGQAKLDTRFRVVVDFCRGWSWRDAARRHGRKVKPTMFSDLVDAAETILVGPNIYRIDDACAAGGSDVFLRDNARHILPFLRAKWGIHDYLAEELEAHNTQHTHRVTEIAWRVSLYNPYAREVQHMDMATAEAAAHWAEDLARRGPGRWYPIVGRLALPYPQINPQHSRSHP